MPPNQSVFEHKRTAWREQEESDEVEYSSEESEDEDELDRMRTDSVFEINDSKSMPDSMDLLNIRKL